MHDTCKKSVICGVFDSESFLRRPELAKLPSMQDNDIDRIVAAMDEILFPLCENGDLLITRNSMNRALRDYIRGLGLAFSNNEIGVEDKTIKSEDGSKNIFELLYKSINEDYFKKLFGENNIISTFAVVPYIEEVCKKYKSIYQGPKLDIVERVNSKTYSTGMRDVIGIKNLSDIVHSYDMLREKGSRLLKNGPFLIKDVFGVSGKGSLLINQESIFERICRYLENQELNGKKIEFVLEPFLQKETDFSCQLYIKPDGNVNIISLHKMDNDGFRFRGMYALDKGFISMLEANKYIDSIEQIGCQMYRDGYYGNVCIDSMILRNGEIVPIVEINARKSMSNIKLALDKHFNSTSSNSVLTYYSLGCKKDISFEDLLQKMSDAGLLFDNTTQTGILPMSGNAFEVNRFKGKGYRARLYTYIIYKDEEDKSKLCESMCAMLRDFSAEIME